MTIVMLESLIIPGCAIWLFWRSEEGESGMKKGSVKKRIFISNALMVLVSLLVFLAINLVIIKGYSETIEKEIKTSVETFIKTKSQINKHP